MFARCFSIAVLFLLPAQILHAQEFASKLTDRDWERIEMEIAAFGLKDAARVSTEASLLSLPDTVSKLIIVRRSALKHVHRLSKLESVYIIIDEIEELDLELLSGCTSLKRLSLGMPSRHGMKQEFWAPVSKLSNLEQFDVNCDP